ncbi:MAG: hypothetical protein ACLFPE_12550, partial [Bacteroidales bacterium]
ELRLHRTRNTEFPYSGVMLYSSQCFRDGLFAVLVNIDMVENAKFAFWLKSYHHDVHEEDIVEVMNQSNFRFKGVDYQKMLFTHHGGTHYELDHHQRANGCVTRKGPHLLSIERENGWLDWRIDGILVKRMRDPHPEHHYGLIIDWEPCGVVPKEAVSFVSRLVVMDTPEKFPVGSISREGLTEYFKQNGGGYGKAYSGA